MRASHGGCLQIPPISSVEVRLYSKGYWNESQDSWLNVQPWASPSSSSALWTSVSSSEKWRAGLGNVKGQNTQEEEDTADIKFTCALYTYVHTYMCSSVRRKGSPFASQSAGTFYSHVFRTFAVCTWPALDGKTVYSLWKFWLIFPAGLPVAKKCHLNIII